MIEDLGIEDEFINVVLNNQWLLGCYIFSIALNIQRQVLSLQTKSLRNETPSSFPKDMINPEWPGV
jgi:hypothetical protein